MLLDRRSEEDLRLTLQALASGQAILLVGQTFLDQAIDRTLAFPRQTSALPILEQAYLAGKAASIIGADKIKTMNARAISEYLVENSIYLDEADRAVIAGLKTDTLKWIEGRSGAWQGRLNQLISRSNREFTAFATEKRYNDLAEIEVDRRVFLTQIIDELQDTLMPSFQGEAQRLLQTEVATYFQQGQTTGKSGEELVYKVPRAGCCKHCARLHVKSDGTPIKYRLRDVRGNSNIGKPAGLWKFTIGSTHPHCYCVLYYDSQNPATKQTRLTKHISHDGCGTVADETLYEEQLMKGIDADAHPAVHEFDQLIASLLEPVSTD